MSKSIAVIGAGAWGTALAVTQASAGLAVRLWARTPSRAASIDQARTNPRLPGIVLPKGVQVTSDMGTAIGGAAAVLLAVPVQHLRDIASRLSPATAPLVICAKGVEAQTLLLPMEILAQCHPGVPAAVLSGPNFAAEIAGGLPAAAVLAGADQKLRATLIDLLATRRFRLYGNVDVMGVQIGGAAKNVIAIAAGIVIGGGLGENARAALVTRSLAEIARLTVTVGGRMETVMGLSGLGDLLLTCTGPRSRNFSLGVALGQGATLREVLAGRTVVTEGVATAPALLARAGDVEMPICAAVTRVLDGTLSPFQAMQELLARRLRDE